MVMDLNKMEKQIHQAVVLIDCYDFNNDDETKLNNCFNSSKVLLRLFDRPLLEYTIEMLLMSNIDEIFLFCSNYYDELRKFLSEYKAKYHMNDHRISLQLFYSEDYTNLGSIMRDLDAKCIIKSNFILIHGDCIGNLRLDEIIDKHKENVAKDPGCVMTCIFRRLNPSHRQRLKQQTMIILDRQQKIVLYEKSMKKRIELPVELFTKNSTLSIHYDLFDTQIAVCSEKVPPDFSDNFDFETRENFIHGLLAHMDLLCHHIHVVELEEGYAARVDSIESYVNISKDLRNRYVYPIVPGNDDDNSKMIEHLKTLVIDDSGEIRDQNDQKDEEIDEINEDYDTDSTKFSDSSDDSFDSDIGDEYSTFYHEVCDSLSRGIDENSLPENIILEINSSKHAYNVPVSEVNSLVIKALLNLAIAPVKTDDSDKDNVQSILQKIRRNLQYGLMIIRNYIKNEQSQNDCIYSCEEFHLTHKELIGAKYLVIIIKYLYENSVIDEDIILKWYYKPKNLTDHTVNEQETLRKAKELQLFIRWLEEAEEESSSDDDDD